MSAAPSRRGWNIALIISICLNLILAGIIAMAVYRFGGHPPVFAMGGPVAGQADRMQVRQIMSPRLLMRVAPDKADALRTAAKSHRDRLDALRNNAMAARREVLRLYVAPTVDKAALDAALGRMQQADAAIEIEILKSTSETAVLLTPDERRKALEWQPHDHGFRGGFGHHRGGDDEPTR